MTSSSTAFALPERLAAKADPALVAADDAHFAAITAALEHSIADLSGRLAELRAAPARDGEAAYDRDREIHRLTARLRLLRRFGLDLCLGRMAPADGSAPVYVGRLGLTDDDGERLLIDWRSPAAAPFFGATHAQPMGLASRRRYRWSNGRIGDYWDEVFTADGLDGHAALDDQSVFIASLGGSRSSQMRDVLGTIQSDQDAIIRAGSPGTLVVDGGPGTGKTVVALHRAAYLVYSDPRLDRSHGGMLFVGPHQPYLDYVADVLPSLGEDGVRTCTLRDLVPESATARPEPDPNVVALKSSADLVRAVDTAVRFYEDPPKTELIVATEWGNLSLSPLDWAEAFAKPAPGTAHNDARGEVWDELLDILLAQHDGPPAPLRRALNRHEQLTKAFNRAWPMLTAHDVIADLWSTPAYLRLCAPWLTRDQIRLLQRKDPYAWTVRDLPLLDAARLRLGDPQGATRTRRRAAAAEAQREEIGRVVQNLLDADHDGEGGIAMLAGADLQEALIDEAALPPAADVDALAGPFAHVVVDEAQELTDAEWQMLLLRCPSRSFTVVGDRAQARHGFTETWAERLERIGLDRTTMASLTVNYRTPAEVMAAAAPVIRAALPDANVPTSIRPPGAPVRHAARAERDDIVAAWLAGHDDGIACVIGDSSFEAQPRVRSLTPTLAKGLEFDLVVLVEPERFGSGIEGAVDRYVAMTRATRELVVLT